MRSGEPIQENFGQSNFTSFAPEKLIGVVGRIDQPKRQTIGLGDVVNIVGRDDRSRARHVLHEDFRVSGNVPAQMLCDKAAPIVHGAAGRIANYQPDGFAFEKFVRACMRDSADEPKDKQGTQDFFHNCPFFLDDERCVIDVVVLVREEP